MALQNNLPKALNKFKSWAFKRYADNTDRFLLDTAAIGWILASFSNMTSVFFNKKIDKDRRKYMATQELVDGFTNVALFYGITFTMMNGARALVRKGKIGSKGLNEEGKNLLMGGAGTLASLMGAVVTNNIITPIVRNKCATFVQKKFSSNQSTANMPVYKPTSSIPYTAQKNPMSINSYMAFTKSGGNLKI